MIEYVYLWDNTRPVTNLSFSDYRGDRYINVLSLLTRGVEASLTYKSKKVNGLISWQYLNGQFKFDPDNVSEELHSNFHLQSFSNGSFLVGEEVTSALTRRPSMQLMGSLSFNPFRTLSLNGHYRMVSNRNDSFYDPSIGPFGALNLVEMKAFHIFTLNASYTHINLTTGFQVENIFNTQYQEIQGFRSRGRGAGIKIQCSF